MSEPMDIFKALADESRLRMVRALGWGELSVGELALALGLSQPSVSRHLRPLREAGLVAPRPEGTAVFYHQGPRWKDDPVGALVGAALDRLSGGRRDRAAVDRVVEQRKARSRDFFDRVAGGYGGLLEPGGSWRAMASVLACGFAGCRVADLGAGEGELSIMLARFASEVLSVDHSDGMLAHLRRRAGQAGCGARIRTVKADLESIPVRDASIDAVFLSQALHHAARPREAVGEAARLLRPKGLLMVLDWASHTEEWAREEWADQWLGFTPDQLRGWLAEAGLTILDEESWPAPGLNLKVLSMVAQRGSSPASRKTARDAGSRSRRRGKQATATA